MAKMMKRPHKKGKVLKPKVIRRTEKEEQEMNNSKSQVVSIDTMIATLIFMAAITGLLVYIGVSSEKSKVDYIQKEADLIPQAIITSNKSGLSIMTMNRIDSSRLAQLSQKDYEDLRSELGLKYDFCIFFEDTSGDVVNLSPIIGSNTVGIGTSDATVGGIPCGRRS